MEPNSYVIVPHGWQRLVEKNSVMYVSPSQSCLRNREEVIRYLSSPATCKCGLKCPFSFDDHFIFDPNIIGLPDNQPFSGYSHCNLVPNLYVDNRINRKTTGTSRKGLSAASTKAKPSNSSKGKSTKTQSSKASPATAAAQQAHLKPMVFPVGSLSGGKSLSISAKGKEQPQLILTAPIGRGGEIISFQALVDQLNTVAKSTPGFVASTSVTMPPAILAALQQQKSKTKSVPKIILPLVTSKNPRMPESSSSTTTLSVSINKSISSPRNKETGFSPGKAGTASLSSTVLSSTIPNTIPISTSVIPISTLPTSTISSITIPVCTIPTGMNTFPISAGTIPAGTIPAGTIPASNVCTDTIPISDTIPTTIPSTIPAGTSAIPTDTTPIPTSTNTAPVSTIPTSTVPNSTTPTDTAPVSTISASTVPISTTPTDTAPVSTISASTVPNSTTPTDTAPVSTISASIVPISTTPTDTAPVSTVPNSTIPTDTAPVSTISASTVPISTTPTDTAPVSTIPASTIPSPIVPTSAIPTNTVPVSAIPTSTISTNTILTTVPVSAMPTPIISTGAKEEQEKSDVSNNLGESTHNDGKLNTMPPKHADDTHSITDGVLKDFSEGKATQTAEILISQQITLTHGASSANKGASPLSNLLPLQTIATGQPSQSPVEYSCDGIISLHSPLHSDTAAATHVTTADTNLSCTPTVQTHFSACSTSKGSSAAQTSQSSLQMPTHVAAIQTNSDQLIPCHQSFTPLVTLTDPAVLKDETCPQEHQAKLSLSAPLDVPSLQPTVLSMSELSTQHLESIVDDRTCTESTDISNAKESDEFVTERKETSEACMLQPSVSEDLQHSTGNDNYSCNNNVTWDAYTNNEKNDGRINNPNSSYDHYEHNVPGNVGGKEGHDVLSNVDQKEGHDVLGNVSQKEGHDVLGGVGQKEGHDVLGNVGQEENEDVLGNVSQKEGHDVLGSVGQKEGHDVLGNVDQKEGHDVLGNVDQKEDEDVLGNVSQKEGHDVLGSVGQKEGHDVLGNVDQKEDEDVLGSVRQKKGHDIHGYVSQKDCLSDSNSTDDASCKVGGEVNSLSASASSSLDAKVAARNCDEKFDPFLYGYSNYRYREYNLRKRFLEKDNSSPVSSEEQCQSKNNGKMTKTKKRRKGKLSNMQRDVNECDAREYNLRKRKAAPIPSYKTESINSEPRKSKQRKASEDDCILSSDKDSVRGCKSPADSSEMVVESKPSNEKTSTNNTQDCETTSSISKVNDDIPANSTAVVFPAVSNEINTVVSGEEDSMSTTSHDPNRVYSYLMSSAVESLPSSVADETGREFSPFSSSSQSSVTQFTVGVPTLAVAPLSITTIENEMYVDNSSTSSRVSGADGAITRHHRLAPSRRPSISSGSSEFDIYAYEQSRSAASLKTTDQSSDDSLYVRIPWRKLPNHRVVQCYSANCFKVGDVVWAKAAGLRAWPAQIIKNSDWTRNKLGTPPENYVWVRWYNSQSVSIVEEDNLKPLLVGFDKKYLHSKRKKEFDKAFKEAAADLLERQKSSLQL